MACLTRRAQLWLGSAVAVVATVAVLVMAAPMLDLGAGALTLIDEDIRDPYTGEPWYTVGSMPVLLFAVTTYALVGLAALVAYLIHRSGLMMRRP